MRNFLSLIFLCAFYVMAGCQTNPVNPGTTLQSTATVYPSDFAVIVTVYPVETMTPFITTNPDAIPSFEPTLETIVSKAKNDLVQKISVDPANIRILEVESVEWPDSSLGCRQPGEIYLPVITPGFRILLEVDEQVYSYHTDTTNHFILCEMPGPILINPTQSR